MAILQHLCDAVDRIPIAIADPEYLDRLRIELRIQEHGLIVDFI